MPEVFSDRVTQYIDTVVQKLAPLSVTKQNEQLKIVEAKCSAKTDAETTRRIMTTIREKLMMTPHKATASVISGLSITGTMINGPSAAGKKRVALQPSVKKAKIVPEEKVKLEKEKKEEVEEEGEEEGEEEEVEGRLLSDGFIIDDVGEGTIIECDEDDDDDDDDDNENGSEDEIEAVFDHQTYTNEQGKVEFEKMEEAVRKEVKTRRQNRANTLLGGVLAAHTLPDDDPTFHAIRAKHTLNQYNRTKMQIVKLTTEMEESKSLTAKRLLSARLASLKEDAAEQLAIIRQGGLADLA